jgi:hypothetical protein
MPPRPKASVVKKERKRKKKSRKNHRRNPKRKRVKKVPVVKVVVAKACVVKDAAVKVLVVRVPVVKVPAVKAAAAAPENPAGRVTKRQFLPDGAGLGLRRALLGPLQVGRSFVNQLHGSRA